MFPRKLRHKCQAALSPSDPSLPRILSARGRALALPTNFTTTSRPELSTAFTTADNSPLALRGQLVCHPPRGCGVRTAYYKTASHIYALGEESRHARLALPTKLSIRKLTRAQNPLQSDIATFASSIQRDLLVTPWEQFDTWSPSTSVASYAS